MTAYIEVAASWLFKNAKGRDAKAFFTSPAFASHPEPTLPITSPDCGQDGATLGKSIYLGIPVDKTSVVNSDFNAVNDKSTRLAGGFYYGQSRNGAIYIVPRPLLNHGIHRYWFEIIGLSEPLDEKLVTSKPTRDQVAEAINGKVVVWGRWMGQYSTSPSGSSPLSRIRYSITSRSNPPKTPDIQANLGPLLDGQPGMPGLIIPPSITGKILPVNSVPRHDLEYNSLVLSLSRLLPGTLDEPTPLLALVTFRPLQHGKLGAAALEPV
ncbi:hypothetical protein NM208_g16810 [Fusarium decemcellulare]|uniref:Uncharacterized protein n=1 Tax=Fusarium decemcellulare TaxID=57161 RepID=A0ACC1R960_9HYPO|nr:hypothetical protein NM208_g16810 [Fusarium decemcellulare]